MCSAAVAMERLSVIVPHLTASHGPSTGHDGCCASAHAARDLLIIIGGAVLDIQVQDSNNSSKPENDKFLEARRPNHCAARRLIAGHPRRCGYQARIICARKGELVLCVADLWVNLGRGVPSVTICVLYRLSLDPLRSVRFPAEWAEISPRPSAG